jgi:hypothetical protein
MENTLKAQSPLQLNLLDILAVNNVYSLHAFKFIHLWHKGLLPNLFNAFFQYASNIHNYNTRYASKQYLYKPRVKSNTGKQMISFIVIDLWKKSPDQLKDLNIFSFSKKLKHYLLTQQYLARNN